MKEAPRSAKSRGGFTTFVRAAASSAGTWRNLAMMRRMRELGARGAIEARLIGGASMFTPLLAPGSMSLGARNVAATHSACSAAEIPIVGQDIGGTHGRSVYFDVAAGEVLVRSMQRGDVRL